MKTPTIKLFAIFFGFTACIGSAYSQELIVTHTAAGNLENEVIAKLNGTDISSITHLTLTGENINTADATYLRTAFKNNLQELDISGITFTDKKLTDKLCQQMSALKKVTLPDSIATIGKYAFQTCNNLTEVIWKSVENIDDYAFAKCTKLHITSLPENMIRIGQYGFSKCSQIKITKLPVKLIGLGIRAFEFCSNLAIKEISPSITEIRERLFDRTGITEFTISENVTKISNLGFYAENNPTRTFTCRRETAPTLGTTAFGAVNGISNTTVNILKKYATAYSTWETAGIKLDFLTKNIHVSITGNGTVTASGVGLVSEMKEITNGTNILVYEGEDIIINAPKDAIIKIGDKSITPDIENDTLYRIQVGNENLDLKIDLSVTTHIAGDKEDAPFSVNLSNNIVCVSGTLHTPIFLFSSSGNLLLETTNNTIDMNGFASGFYVVMANNKTFKMTR